MKFNIIFLLFPAALLTCYWLAVDFQGKSENQFFGMAEVDPKILNFDHDMEVRELYITAGDRVKKGDTIAILARADLDKAESSQLGEIARMQTERNAELSILEKEKELVNTRFQAKMHELTAQIQLMRTEDSLKTAYRKNLYPDLTLGAESKLLAEKTAALQKEMAGLEAQTREELRVIEAKQAANRQITDAKTGETQTEMSFVRAERGRLLLISPIDGYVEEVYVGKNSLVPAHRDLLKINPLKPTRIIGFIHEAADIPFSIGQEVDLVSTVRPEVVTKGIIIGSDPKMTEMPLRLRKYIEIRSWGREVYIQLPADNSFFISEKISITLPHI